MWSAINEKGQRVWIGNADHASIYTCPACGDPLSYKAGKSNLAHFCHNSGKCSDTWQYDYSAWCYEMQSMFPEESRNVVVRVNTPSGTVTHVADALIDDTVFLFQHKSISKHVFEEKTNFFLARGYRLVWIIDLSKQFHTHQITQELSTRSPFDSKLVNPYYIWDHPLRAFENCPTLSDYDPRCALYFYDDKNTWHRVIEPDRERRDRGIVSLSRFRISPYAFTATSPDVCNPDAYFLSGQDHWNNFLESLPLEHRVWYENTNHISGKSSRCHCPDTERQQFVSIWTTCAYCPYCASIAFKDRPTYEVMYSACCWPTEYRERDTTDPIKLQLHDFCSMAPIFYI